MKITGKTLLLFCLALASIWGGGCTSSSSPSGPAGSQGSGQDVGAVGISLTIGSGFQINTVNWTVNNTGTGYTQTGSVPVQNSQKVAFIVSNIPGGAGYSIQLTAATTDGSYSCLGSATFTVVPRATTVVSVTLTCTRGVDGGSNGSVYVNGTVVIAPSCAVVTSLSASPAEVDVGSSLALTASGVDNSGTGSAVLLSWAVTAGPGTGTFSSPTSASPTFTCTGAGAVTVTATATTADAVSCTGNTSSQTLQCDVPAGTSDASVLDTGVADTGIADTGVADAGLSCSTQQAQCTAFLAANQATFLNVTNVCSGTELVYYGKVKTGGTSTGACLGCALTSGCLDDTFVAPGADAGADINHECEDLTATGGATSVAQCLGALGCDLNVSTSCPDTTGGTAPVWNTTTSQGIVNNAYCGIGTTTTVCTGTGAGQGPAGSCAASIAAGFPAGSNATFILNNLTNPVYPAGVADKSMACALANCAASCFP